MSSGSCCWVCVCITVYGTATQYDREVAVLLRDRKSGAPLYETRAQSEGGYSSRPELLAAMFEAALKDFPKSGPNPRTVTVPITKKS